MYSAIKNRRGGLLNDAEENAHQMPMKGEKQGDLQSIVSALSEEQKMELMNLLSADMSGGESREIEKGAMGPGEKAEIEVEIGNEAEDDMGESEDEIAQDMVSSADQMRAESGVKPRNLAERARIEMAKKLKNKKGV